MDRRVFIGTAAVVAFVLSSRANSQRAEKLPQVALVFNNVAVAEMTAHPMDRAFVDGLRAISILAVVGFHIGLPGFSGGFVGVDVFFVISGFLIINQIKYQPNLGSFPFDRRKCEL